jgi:exosortase/archaeosortase family protein
VSEAKTEIRSRPPKTGSPAQGDDHRPDRANTRFAAGTRPFTVHLECGAWNDNCPATDTLESKKHDESAAARAPELSATSPVFGLGARFALRFALIAGAFFAVYCFPYAEHGISERWFDRYLSAYASMAGGVLSVFEPSVHVSGTNIIGRIPLQIVKNCDAIEINVLFVAAVLAFPGLTRRRVVAAAAGVVLLVVANVARLCSLYYVGIYAPSSFEFFHLELWPLVLVILAAVNFLLWASWLQRPAAPLPSPAGG